MPMRFADEADLGLTDGRFRLARRNHRYAVIDETDQLVCPAGAQIDRAIGILVGVARKEREASVVERRCMCCPAKFFSEGPHHRLCSTCRQSKARLGKEWL